MSYFRWGINADIELVLALLNPDGTGAQSATPEVGIRRHRSAAGALDDKWWDGATFQSSPQWLPMTEFDSSNNPGLYTYLFEQSLLKLEQSYLVYFRNQDPPRAVGVEEHVITRELPMVGLRQVTVHVRDGDDNAVPDATISVFTGDNALFLQLARTDENGDVVLALNDATYALRIARTFYTFTVPETLTVTADDEVTYNGERNFPAETPDPDRCWIYGQVLDANGNGIAGLDVDAYATSPQVIHGVLAGDHVGNTRTDTAGRFRIPLYRDMEVHFTVEDTAWDFDRTVPDAADQDVTTWT